MPVRGHSVEETEDPRLHRTPFAGAAPLEMTLANGTCKTKKSQALTFAHVESI
jgi:hypothetical protein